MRKIIIFVLLFCLLLAGCGKGAPSLTDTSAATDETEAPLSDTLSLLDGEGKPLYRVVRPDRASDIIKNAGVELRLALNTLSGVEFAIANDFLNTSKNETADGVYEILLGATNRAESAAVAQGLGLYDYVICVMGEKIVITGGSDYATFRAAEEFMTHLEGQELLLSSDFRLEQSVDVGPYIIGITNQGESKIDVYDISTGALNDTTRLFCIDVPYFNFAALKLRNHEVWGEVMISAGGNAHAWIVSYPEGKTLWSTYAAADNPHSVELIPGNIFVVASSSGAALRFFDLDGSPNKYVEIAYPDAHGVLWDPENQVVWALGANQLRAYTVTRNAAGEIEVNEALDRRSDVPTGGGHDLAPVYGDTNQLWITAGSVVYRYSKDTKSFTTNFPGSSIIKQKGVKGIGNFADGSIVLVNPDGDFRAWTTATVDFYLFDGTNFAHTALKSATGHFYKCRVWCADYQ